MSRWPTAWLFTNTVKVRDFGMYGKQLSQPISDDYHNSKLTVKQIASKHGVCVRTVYNVINGKTDRKGLSKQPRRYLSLTREEALFLISSIADPDQYPAAGLLNRLKYIIEDLPKPS